MIIGIGGISRSGKSFLARKLHELFEKDGKTVGVFPQDKYVFPEYLIPTINDHIDWERPESIDFPGYIKAIKESSIINDITIAEGLMVFWNPELFNLFTCRIFIELGEEEFNKRKNKDIRWGKEPDWYVEHIWKSYLQYGQIPEGVKMDLVLNGEMDFNLTKNYKVIRESGK